MYFELARMLPVMIISSWQESTTWGYYATNRDHGEALPILKSGIALKKKLLISKADDYLNRLKIFSG